MKQVRNISLLLMGLLMTACGGKDAKKGEAPAAENNETIQSEAFTGEEYSKEAAIYYFNKNYGIDFKELEPGFTYDESGKYTFKGNEQEVSARFKDPEGSYKPEQLEDFVRKIYAATAKASEGGKNVYGFLLTGKSTTEEASQEKTIDEVLKGGYMEIFGINTYSGSYSWAILKDGKFYDVSVSTIENKNAPKDSNDPFAYVGNGLGIDIGLGLQKSMDETMKDAEDALERIENDPELRKQVEDALSSQ